MKRINYLIVLTVLTSVAWVPAHASGDPGSFTGFVRGTPYAGGQGGDPTGNGCATSPENPTVLLAALSLGGLMVGRRISRTARLRTVAVAR